MRKIICSIWLFLISVQIFPQGDSTVLHLFHAGDEVFKQQVEYKDPGRSGESVLWDFSQLQTVNPKYKLQYVAPVQTDSGYVMGGHVFPAERLSRTENLIIGNEHETSYFYSFRHDSLFCLGHQNAVVSLWYTLPLLMNVYSSPFQNPITLPFSARGIYSMQVPIRTQGTMTVEWDATGMMLLPSGDTLRHVSRLKSLQKITDLSKVEDSVALAQTGSPAQTIEMETYRWYAKGYRYPIFETVCSYTSSGGSDSDRNANFTTAFFYPPEEAFRNEAYSENEDTSDDITDPWEGLTYNVYPNPVSTYAEVELFLPREANIVVLLTSSQGIPIQKKQFPTQPKGLFRFQLDLVGYTRGNYVLDIWLNDHLVSEKIMKL